jgi:hypothetical protein
MDFDISVKFAIYSAIADTGKAPTIEQVAAKLDNTTVAIREAFQRLFAKRLLVLEPDTFEIRMAPPFSAVPTSFAVSAAGKSYFANCVWDAYGIAAALHQDVDVSASCGCCREPMTLAVREGTPIQTPGIAHFAVPAAHWWDDIVYT